METLHDVFINLLSDAISALFGFLMAKRYLLFKKKNIADSKLNQAEDEAKKKLYNVDKFRAKDFRISISTYSLFLQVFLNLLIEIKCVRQCIN